MRPRVNGASKLAACFLLLATLTAYADPGVSAGEESAGEPSGEQEKKPGWEPSIAVTSGFIFGNEKASVESSFADGSDLRPSNDGSDWQVAPFVGINAELMTPEVPGIPGGVRLFVNGEYLPVFSTSLDIAKEGSGSGFDVPVVDRSDPFPDPSNPFEPCPQQIGARLSAPNCGCPFGTGCFPESGISGQGSRTTAEITRDFFGAAVGVAVPFELAGRKLMIKPSVGWVRYTVDVEGVVQRAIKDPFVTTVSSPNERQMPFWRLVNLQDSSREHFNAIGPGLEVEMQVHQVGPIDTTLYIDAHGYRVLGDRKVDLSDSTTLNCSNGTDFRLKSQSDAAAANLLCRVVFGGQTGEDSYSARWSFKVDPWLYRIGLGLRFRWVGE